ncbi:MAG: DUF3536 domain-containing protein [Bacteroidetes bacterium]|nr:DUF3536 domain-containing protein [Bacteroidota bacterium]
MNTTNKFICIHGHFYQPPRENAWLEYVELQESSSPFHDWNERINHECYAPNASARILGGENYIKKIVNNYTRVSFNYGPTLLYWMEKADWETYGSILDADKIGQTRFGGHGSAIAQVHSHLIMPLANLRDKETQVKWGIRDFEFRFGRKPEGIWLAETAADTETLEVLADHDITYTILAPRQAKSFKKIKNKNWHSVHNENIDTRRPYLCKLPSGKSIVLFFYHGGIAQKVAFDGILNDGGNFAQSLTGAFDDNDTPQLVHIATDGETYGHHHRYGEMALAACLNHIEENNLATITNYGEYLEKFPPEYEAQIHDNSSWSCVHGVERWRSNCGCNSGGNSGWTQEWRKGLRETLNWLRDELIPLYEKEASKLLKDCWKARDEYIDIILRRDPKTVDKFFKTHTKKSLTKKEKIRLLRLLEMQRNAMLMFTSCGWFFDEISGIETNQILQYANRAIYYARQVGNVDYHPEFIERLEKTPSNLYENGAASYKENVIPARVNLERVGMHYAVASLFEPDPEELPLFNYQANSETFDRRKAGNQIIAVGRTTMKSKITYSEKHFSFVVLYLGQQSIIGKISVDMPKNTFDEMHEKTFSAFQRSEVGEVIDLMQQYFGSKSFTFRNLFRDEKHKIIKNITDKSLKDAEYIFREIFNDDYQLMTTMLTSDIPIPSAYRNVVEYILNRDIENFFEQDFLKIRELKRLVREIKKWNVKITDPNSFRLSAGERIYYEMRQIASARVDLKHLKMLATILKTLKDLHIDLDIWKSQNLYLLIAKGVENGEWSYPSKEWKQAFIKLGELLEVRVE